ncbi:MAG: hypothetical protein IT457_07435 [Planctomycetes bacterium]|nr:hypothetical protein [Planctomycetota bacterium]
MSGSRRRRRRFRIAAVLLAVLAALFAVELLCRVVWPTPLSIAGSERESWRANPEFAKRYFVADAELGFAPRLGNEVYGEDGCRVHAYPRERQAGVRRVLFLGDSVTFRDRIVAAIRARAGEAGREYFNAGVEGYNTAQELGWFRRHGAALRPDHVVIAVHMNDFESGLVAFHDEQDRMVVVEPERSGLRIWPWLFARSAAYRRAVAVYSARFDRHDFESGAREVETALAALRDELRAGGAELSILALPAFVAEAEWNEHERKSYARVLAIGEALAIRTFDLRPAVAELAAAGIAMEETPGDRWHPNDAAAAAIARVLERAGFVP